MSPLNVSPTSVEHLDKIDLEEYRSGHNEPHSKCGVPQGTVGSNPTSSANRKSLETSEFWGFSLFLHLRRNHHFLLMSPLILGRHGKIQITLNP